MLYAIFRRTHTKACIEWLKWFERKNIPVLVCQTHVDRLIAEQMNDDGIYNTEQVKRQIAEESKVRKIIFEYVTNFLQQSKMYVSS